jgi:hypothetical protein
MLFWGRRILLLVDKVANEGLLFQEEEERVLKKKIKAKKPSDWGYFDA